MNQTSKQATWLDEKGNQIQFSRLTKVEKLMERKSNQLAKKAMAFNKKLKEFKEEVSETCVDIYQKFMAEKGAAGKKTKGNFTWFNFDRTTKIEVSINEKIEFDDLTIKACQDKLHEFLDANVDAKNEMIKDLVLDAFETERGKLDTKKVLGLLKYKSKIKDANFQKAMDLLSDSIRRPSSKTYFRVWMKDEEGKYQNIDLNFSSL